MKRICLVSYLFAPVLSAESMALLKKVRVLAGHFDLTIVTSQNTAGVYPIDPILEEYIPQNVKVVRIPIMPRPNGLHRAAHLAGRILFRGSAAVQYYDLRWARNAAAHVRREAAGGRPFDLLMTNAQHLCSHVAGYWMRTCLPVPWIQHYSDPVQHAAGRTRFLPAQKLDDWVFPRMLRQASLVTMPSPEMKQSFYENCDAAIRQVLPPKTLVVPHTYDDDFMTDALRRYPDRTRYYAEPGAIHVCYAGNLYGIRSAELVANVSRRLRSKGTRPILIHVFGSVRATDRRQLEQMGDSVRFHGNLSYMESLAAMQHSDILLLLDVPAPGSPFFPSKLAEYLGTQKPIIVVAAGDSASARIAREMGLILCPYTDDPIPVDAISNGGALERRSVYSNRAENYGELIERIDGLSR